MDLKDLKIELPPLDEQKAFVSRINALDRIKQTIQALEKSEQDDVPKSWLPYDQGYEPPSGDEIRETFRPHTGSQIASMLGISDSRTVRKWIGGDSKVPYSAWRLYLVLTGRVI